MKTNINLIKIENRFRQDFGDIEELAKSISEIGLLHPPILDSNYRLIDGERRIKAAKHLGFNEIETRIVHVPSLLRAEHDSNAFAKQWTVSEKVAIGKAIEEEIGNRRGQRTDLELSQNFAEVEKGKRTDEIAAEKAGFNNKETYRQAKKVIEEAIPELVDQVNSGEVSISAASIASSLPAQDQREIVEEIKQGGKPSEVIKSHVLATKHTGDEESYTPEKYIESARIVMGDIDLDPASNRMAQETVKAEIYYDIENDGLVKDWKGKVWMNPPYTARVINLFIYKLVNHFNNKEVTEAIVLTNNNTDTSWFHQAALTASAVCFTAGRINFLKRDGSKSSPTNGQAFIYFGDNVSSFRDEFSKYGLVMVKA